MMRPRDDRTSVFICTQAVDFRKGMASLAVLVEAQLGLNPFANSLYVFRNRSASAVKLLYWERRLLPLAEALGAGAILLA